MVGIELINPQLCKMNMVSGAVFIMYFKILSSNLKW